MKWQGRPRRRRRVLAWTASSVLFVLLVVVAGISWYFSGLALAVDHTTTYDLTASPAGSSSVSVTRTHDSTLPGRYALSWDGGWGTMGAIQSQDATTVTRAWTPGSGTLAPGTRVVVSSFAVLGDPRSAQGLDFRDVAVPCPLGSCPAWYVPASSPDALASLSSADRGRTWVVFVHGHDSNRQESLRYLPTLHRLGLPTLVVSYRNDIGAPASPDGFDHLGDTEWQDVDAAIGWALGNGAKDVVLAGWSMGGAVSLQTADRGQHKASVRGLVMESPVIDWAAVLRDQADQRSLPRALTATALLTAELRAGLDFDRLDWVGRAKDLRWPVLVWASDDDTYVRNGPAVRLAAARPDLVTLVKVPGAEHTRSWNVDPASFEQRLATWLGALGVLAAPAQAAA